MQAKKRVGHGDEYSVFEKLKAAGVAVPPFATDARGVGFVGLPAVVVARFKNKPCEKIMITRYGDIAPAIARAVRHTRSFFVQRHMSGHEIACGVMEDGKRLMPLVPIETVPRLRHESVPRYMTASVVHAVQAQAKKAHRAAGAKRYSCVRLVVAEGTPYVVRVDAAPPLTRTGLFTRSAEVAGFTLPELQKLL